MWSMFGECTGRSARHPRRSFPCECEGLADPAALAANDDTLEDLDAFLGALDDLDVHVDGVAGAEGRDVVAQRRLIDEVQVFIDTSCCWRPGQAFAVLSVAEARCSPYLGVSRSRRS